MSRGAATSDSFRSQRVAVTGGAGFLGTAVVERLRAAGCEPFVPRRRQFDLRTEDGVQRFLQEARPELLLHLAAHVGGIGANQARPAEMFHDNLVMGARLIDAAHRAGVSKFVCVGTTCAYPAHTPVPFKEQDLWEGYPEPTNAPYGVAKKALLVQLQAYREQYGFNGIFLLPTNLYGPGDSFDLASSHVIPALIRKCVEARRTGARSVACWGTGQPTRDVLFVGDCADGVLAAAAGYDEPDPLNLGSGVEVRIRDLATMIARATGYEGGFTWDASRPDGQLRRCLDPARARDRIGFVARTALDVGLARTVEWYERTVPPV